MKIPEFLGEKWSTKYKRSIDCSRPKGFSQRAHCRSRKTNENVANNSPTSNITRTGYNNLYQSLASSLQSNTQVKEDMFDFGTIANVLLSSPSYAQAVIMNALRKAQREWSQSKQMISTMRKMATEQPVTSAEERAMRTQFGDLVTYGMIAGVATLTGTGALASASSGATGIAAGGTIALVGAYKKEILDVIKREGPDIIIGIMQKSGTNVINDLIHKFLDYNYVLPKQDTQNDNNKQDVKEDSMSHDWIIYVNGKPATKYDNQSDAQRDLAAVKRKRPNDDIVIKRREHKFTEKNIDENVDTPSTSNVDYRVLRKLGRDNWTALKNAFQNRTDATFNYLHDKQVISYSSGDVERLFNHFRTKIGGNKTDTILTNLGQHSRVKSYLSGISSTQNEDVGSTPGGVGASTKMVCEVEPEEVPRIRYYENSFGRPRWEVLDWRGQRVMSFDNKGAAKHYLRTHYSELEHPEGPLREGMKLTPQQQCGRNIWQEIQRAAKHRGVDKSGDSDKAKLKFYDGSVVVIPQSLAKYLQEKLHPLCVGPKQLQVFSQLCRQEFLHSLTSNLNESPVNKSGVRMQRNPKPETDFIFKTGELVRRGVVRREEDFNRVGMYWYEKLGAYAIPWYKLGRGGLQHLEKIERVIDRKLTPQEYAKFNEAYKQSWSKNRDAEQRAADDATKV